ncbi:hypothetical protein LEP1GSC087_1298 [Leptospira interrogans serovar Bataviae str. L1111]|nr:hypothetical protein LEP1GSC087_1298 [Leptospira interrogans serovar Bataviae str. L1111]
MIFTQKSYFDLNQINPRLIYNKNYIYHLQMINHLNIFFIYKKFYKIFQKLLKT